MMLQKGLKSDRSIIFRLDLMNVVMWFLLKGVKELYTGHPTVLIYTNSGCARRYIVLN